MTTIVAAQVEYGAVIMSDSALNFFNDRDEATHQVYSPSKLTRHGELVVGIAGDTKATTILERYMNYDVGDLQTISDVVEHFTSQVLMNEAVSVLDGEWDMVVVCPFGVVAVTPEWAYEPPTGLHAIGSGAPHALPVLHAMARKAGTMGINEADVELALDMAIKMDPFSCNPKIKERCRRA